MSNWSVIFVESLTKGINYNKDILIFIVEFPKWEDIFTSKQRETGGHSVFRLRENPWWYFYTKDY